MSHIIRRTVFQSHGIDNPLISDTAHGPSGVGAIAIICFIVWPSAAGVPRWNGQPGVPCGGVVPCVQLVQTHAASPVALYGYLRYKTHTHTHTHHIHTIHTHPRMHAHAHAHAHTIHTSINHSRFKKDARKHKRRQHTRLLSVLGRPKSTGGVRY